MPEPVAPSHRRYCALIPARDAAGVIGALVRRVTSLGVDAVVVDDGSRDATAAAAAGQGALVISHLRREGRGAAWRTGFEYALRTRYDGVITLDPSEGYDAGEIPRFIEAGERQHAGLVLGDRRGGTGRREGLAASIISAVARQPVPDPLCGLRLIRRELLGTLPQRFRRSVHATDLVCAAALRRWKIVSVPVGPGTPRGPFGGLGETAAVLTGVVRCLVAG